MRPCVVFLNLRTNKKVVLTNRKLAWQVYELICQREQIKYVSYPHFSQLLSSKPFRFLDYEVTFTNLYSPMHTVIDDLYKEVATRVLAPIGEERSKLLGIDLTDHRSETGTGPASPAPES